MQNGNSDSEKVVGDWYRKIAIRNVVRSIIFFIFISLAPGAILLLETVDEQGRPVRLSKAELLLATWGGVHRLSLPTASPMRIALDSEWLRSRWPVDLDQLMAAYFYFQAEGYCSVRSESFLWIKGVGEIRKPAVLQAEIRFPRTEKTTIRPGETKKMKLVLRKPGRRFLRLVDDEGQPVPGVKVNRYMYWSALNHCGALAGAEDLGKAESDLQGRVPVPDGDFEYAFELYKSRYILRKQHPFTYEPMVLITLLKTEETVVPLHRLRKRSVEMRVRREGKPVAGLWLAGCMAYCPCGACCGNVCVRSDTPCNSTSDRQGKVIIPDFYPEELSRVFFLDKEGKEIWSTDPNLWPAEGVIQVDLPPIRKNPSYPLNK